MAIVDVIDEIISGLQPENVPIDYIKVAKFTDRHGVEFVIYGDALVNFMKNPHEYNVSEARIVFNVKKIRLLLWSHITNFFMQLDTKVDEMIEE